MTRRFLLIAAGVLLVASISCAAPDQPHQSTLDPARAEAAKKYPRIVLYSVAWCPHCREVKEYLTKNEIPFINRDVEVDTIAMEELTGKYGSTGVPVIVFGSGNNEVVLRGFTPELFQEYLKKAKVNK
ncbi:MAG: NrdH-redoxin [Steroidobacteraceae bacterium]|nr:NrdH-redoxin [Deltaproteobacteria bacterium]